MVTIGFGRLVAGNKVRLFGNLHLEQESRLWHMPERDTVNAMTGAYLDAINTTRKENRDVSAMPLV